jgi:hypothetical protein
VAPPAGGAPDLGDVVEALRLRAAAHLTQGPVPEREVEEFAKRLDVRLPPELVALLTQVGNGIFFGEDELFGPRRLMVHDIELVPDMLTVKSALPTLPATWLPFHRRGRTVHAVQLGAHGYGTVFSSPAGATWPDVAAFARDLLRR